MSHRKAMNGKIVTAALLGLVLVLGACETGRQTGALSGAGMGAVVGQIIGKNTESTLIGAAIGTGVGYIIGNETDREKAARMSQASPDGTHDEVGPLGGTRWQLVSLNAPGREKKDYVSKILEFKADGRLLTTTTYPDGEVKVDDEGYRVVGNTLIVNEPGLLINARFKVSGDEMIVDAEDFSAVLRRMPS